MRREKPGLVVVVSSRQFPCKDKKRGENHFPRVMLSDTLWLHAKNKRKIHDFFYLKNYSAASSMEEKREAGSNNIILILSQRQSQQQRTFLFKPPTKKPQKDIGSSRIRMLLRFVSA